MDTIQLQYYIALAKELNFTRVADRFFTTQPTVCRKMDALEEELGIKLINRSTHGVTLTRAGKEYLRYANEIMSIYEVSGRMVRSLTDDPRKTVKCAIFSSSEDELIACNREFNALYPDVQVIVDILTGQAMSEALDNSEYNFYFLHTKLIEGRSDVQFIPTKREKSCLVVRRCDAHKALEGDLIALEKCPFICPAPIEGFILYDLFMRTCAELGIAANIINYYGRASSAFLGVKMGLGNTILPVSLVHEAEGVTLIPVERDNIYLDSCIAWRRNVHTPEIDAFRAVAEAKFGRQNRE